MARLAGRLSPAGEIVAAGLLVMALTAKLTPQIKEWIGGPAGTMISCFVQMLYITFLFPWLMNAIEKRCA